MALKILGDFVPSHLEALKGEDSEAHRHVRDVLDDGRHFVDLGARHQARVLAADEGRQPRTAPTGMGRTDIRPDYC